MLSSVHQLQKHDAMVHDGTSISWESVYKISRTRMDILICYVFLFGVVYQALCVFAMDLTKEQHQILCRPGKKCSEDLGNE
jgi:hypothetical protein